MYDGRDFVNCPNCGSFIMDDTYTKSFHVCRDCAQIFCDECSDLSGSCPNCGSGNLNHRTVEDIIIWKGRGWIVSGKNKWILEDLREEERRRREEEIRLRRKKE